MQTWELEDYNDWNLPFAKTVEIAGRYSGNKTIAEYKETDGDLSLVGFSGTLSLVF